MEIKLPNVVSFWLLNFQRIIFQLKFQYNQQHEITMQIFQDILNNKTIFLPLLKFTSRL